MDSLNKHNQTVEYGQKVGQNHSSANVQHSQNRQTAPVKPVRPVKPVKPGNGSVVRPGGANVSTNQNVVRPNSNMVKQPNNQVKQPNNTNRQGQLNNQAPNKPVQNRVISQSRPVQSSSQSQDNSIQHRQVQQRQVQNSQSNKGLSQRQTSNSVVTNRNVGQTPQQVNKQNNNTQQHIQNNNVTPVKERNKSGLSDNDNVNNVPNRGKMTRLQRQAQGITDENRDDTFNRKNMDLVEHNDYKLVNDNTESFEVKEPKKVKSRIVLLPVAIILILASIIVITFGKIAINIDDMQVGAVSLLSSEPVSKEQFIEAVENKGMQIKEKDLGGGIKETMAYNDDSTYEINYITFDSKDEAQAYYNYIIEEADETESSISSSIVGQNSAESTLISKTYNGFMDITYIDNTIIISIVYDSNKQEEVIDIMNSLGY